MVPPPEHHIESGEIPALSRWQHLRMVVASTSLQARLVIIIASTWLMAIDLGGSSTCVVQVNLKFRPPVSREISKPYYTLFLAAYRQVSWELMVCVTDDMF